MWLPFYVIEDPWLELLSCSISCVSRLKSAVHHCDMSLWLSSSSISFASPSPTDCSKEWGTLLRYPLPSSSCRGKNSISAKTKTPLFCPGEPITLIIIPSVTPLSPCLHSSIYLHSSHPHPPHPPQTTLLPSAPLRPEGWTLPATAVASEIASHHKCFPAEDCMAGFIQLCSGHQNLQLPDYRVGRSDQQLWEGCKPHFPQDLGPSFVM